MRNFYKQRAKKHWATNGDRNTTYFHHVVLKRRRKNIIVSIKDDNNTIQVDQQAIANTSINYFKNLFSSSNVNNGCPYIHTIQPEGGDEYTYNIPDKKEIWETLKAMKRTPLLDLMILM